MPSGFQQGKDYVGLVGDDLYAMGQKTADDLAAAMGGEGELGFLYFDANAYVVNQRDAAFRTTIEKKYPNIKIVSAGFPDASRVFQVASAMILNIPNSKPSTRHGPIRPRACLRRFAPLTATTSPSARWTSPILSLFRWSPAAP